MGGFLLRVDAGPGIGLGHVQRSLALAESLRRAGHHVSFLLASHRDDSDRVKRHGFETDLISSLPIGGPEECDLVAATAHRRAAGVIVIDSYSVRADLIGRLRSAGFRIVSIADEAREPTVAHVLVNGGANARSLPYDSWDSDTRFLLGPDFALLRPEFWDRPDRHIASVVRRILVSVGGDDPHRLTPKIVERLGAWLSKGALDVVVGPFFTDAAAVERAASASSLAVRVLYAPDHLRDLMFASDLAISAGGQTAYELSATGTPAVVMDLFDNQTGGLRALADLGAVAYAGRPQDGELPGEFEPAVRELLTNAALRHQLSATARTVVDGQGAIRVAAEVGQAA